jgi:hypothetical protein
MIPTYAHSMGAIVTRTFGLPTSLTIGSVDNMGGASYRNNCDPIPWVTQQGMRYLLASVPRPVGKNYPLCTQPNQTDCLRGNRWISGAGSGPRTAECDTLNPNDPSYQDRCERWWCAGQPGSPATRIFSGRDTFPGKLSSGNWAYCPNEASYQAGMQACIDQYLAGTTNSTGFLTCLQNIAQLAAGAMSGGADHLLQGRAGAIQYNGYEVLSGLDNLGRPSSFGFRGAYLHNPPPRYPDKPVACGDGVCEAGQETSTSCPSDCYTPCGAGGCDAGTTNYCGNGVCAGSETYSSCPADCPNPCGPGMCDAGM